MVPVVVPVVVLVLVPVPVVVLGLAAVLVPVSCLVLCEALVHPRLCQRPSVFPSFPSTGALGHAGAP